MKTEDRLNIAKGLQNYHYFFREFWDIGDPIIGKLEGISTAAIRFDVEGHAMNLLIDEDFWKSLNEESKLFLICHEMLHIILHHGERFLKYFNTPSMKYMNIATDVVINEMLCRSFNFNRANLNDFIKNEACWLDTIFKNEEVAEGESSEYYFNLLNKDDKDDKNAKYFQFDQHCVMSPEQMEELSKYIKDSGIIDSFDKGLVDAILQDDVSGQLAKELEEGGILAGNGPGGVRYQVNVESKRKKKWESVIKKWEHAHTVTDHTSTERWERTNLLYSQIMTGNIHLPTNCNIVHDSLLKDSINIFFFLDTSGSCIQLKDRFFSAAKSLNPKKFNVRLFCFDTRVYETTISSGVVYGGGGTAFDIIEHSIQRIMKNDNIDYPKAVFLITDGYGNRVHPEIPERWYWFLTNGSTASCIPSKSKKFLLSQYE